MNSVQYKAMYKTILDSLKPT